MSRLEALSRWLQAFGPFGLFLAAGLDSFVPLAHVVDPMVIVLSYTKRDPFTYTLIATAGSVLGSTLLFLLVRAGGEAFVARHIGIERRAQLHAVLDRHGLLAILVGGMLPPPFPLKGLVLVAALARMRLATFALGLTLSRLFRYGLEASLAVVYGDRAMAMMKAHYPTIGLGAILLTLGAWLVGRRLLRNGLSDPATANH